MKQIINELISVHEQLLTLSKEKTKIIKNKEVDDLSPLLMEEKKWLGMLEKKEEKRLQIVTPFFEDKNIQTENRTVTTLLDLMNDEINKEQLESEFVTLTELMVDLKQQEQLNNQLIQQSLQLIQLSLGMISPTIQNMNYGKKDKTKDVRDRSMFDSKA